MDTTSILIVEDRSEIARRLADQVNAVDGWHVCDCVSTLDQALDKLYAYRPRLVLVDLGLPDGSGIELIKAAKQADWLCETLVISIFGDEKRVVNAIAAGASGYLLKGAPGTDFTSDMQAVLDGGSPISPQIARHLLRMVKLSAPVSETTVLAKALTPREMEILTMISHGYKRREIADKLGIMPGTVGIHVNNIYKKLEVNSNIDAVAQAARAGLL